MKDLSINHISIKQSILSDLVNANNNDSNTKVKISLLNNAFVFPVPQDFDIDAFNSSIASYINSELNISTKVETIGDDIIMLPFSPIGLGLMKKAVLYTLIDSHLYINIVPIKEIENANYSEGYFSELLSSGKNESIYKYVEDYIMDLYPKELAEIIKPQGRYFYSSSMGFATIMASHLEPGERILAKLDIYKIEKSKSNAQTSNVDSAFYVSTTNGSYLFVIDKNLQEKYIETLTNEEMKVQSKIGRDPVYCGLTQWISNRDNDYLFDEIAPYNNITGNSKLLAFSQLHFNNGETQNDREYSSILMNIFASADNTAFVKFAAKLIEFSVSLTGNSSVINKVLTLQLMELAGGLFSEEDFVKKLQKFVNDFTFSAKEIVAVIYVICRAKNRISDTKVFADVLDMLKQRYFKVDDNPLNRALVCITVAKKLNIIGEKTLASKIASEALSLSDDRDIITLAPGLDTTPDNKYAGNALEYAALEELYISAQSDKDKYKYAIKMVAAKPLIKSNIENALKYCQDENIKAKLNTVMALFDEERFRNYSYTSSTELEGKFSKLGSYMPQCTGWLKPYSGFKDWVAKVTPDKSITVAKSYGELVNSDNFHLLNELDESLSKYFDIDVDVYVVPNRNQGIMSNDDGESKYIIIDAELLDINNQNYMNGSELTFMLAKEFACLKLGISRLTCHPQWRNYSLNGVHSQDVISVFAPEPTFIQSQSAKFSRLISFSKLMSCTGYFDFDISDTNEAAEMLESTLTLLDYKGESKVAKTVEYEALVNLSASIADRLGLILSGNFVAAVKAIIHNEGQVKGGMNFNDNGTIVNLACCCTADNKPINYDFAMRLDMLAKFYMSDDCKKK